MTNFVLSAGNAITRFMGVLILACSALALWQPEIFRWVAPYVTPLLGCIMFGMGMTLRLKDFGLVFAQPRALLLGLLAQFVCMPLLAFALCHLFSLPPDLAMGVILVGTAPGGTASNVLTFIAKGDVPYSVALTSIATLVALLTGCIEARFDPATSSANLLPDFSGTYDDYLRSQGVIV